MPLINCPDCGKEFSDRAAACPNCGCPADAAAEMLHRMALEAQMVQMATQAFEFHFVDRKGFVLDINDGYATISKRNGKVLASTDIDHVRWDRFYAPKTRAPGTITIRFPMNFSQVFQFSLDQIPEIQTLMESIKESFHQTLDNYATTGRTPKPAKGTFCPKCKSFNISIANTKMKTTLNLNPLKPFTLVNHKATKEQWRCSDCGFRWEQKVK